MSRLAPLRVYHVMDRELELQIVRGLRDGSPAAFDAVYDAFHPRLYNFLARLSNRRDVAEDLLEETWLRLVRHAGRLRPDTRLGPWLFTVARNLHASYCRSRVIEDALVPGVAGLWACGSPSPSPLAALESSEARARLALALGSLPSAHREALLLTAVEGMTPSEAAEICGVSAEAMRQRLSRARARLATLLAEAEDTAVARLREATT